MRVLVTGCDGQVGRSLMERMPENWDVVAQNKRQLDITDHDAVLKALQDIKPQYVINAAAYTLVDKAEDESSKCFSINRDGARNLALGSQKIDAVMLHLSTDYVYSGRKIGPYTEFDTPEPLSVYGKSKLEGELAIAESHSKHIIVRTSWVFSEYGNNFVKTMLRLGLTHQELSIVDDQFGGPTYAGDLAEALLSIIDSLEQGNLGYGLYHLAGLPVVTWRGFADTVFKQAIKSDITGSMEIKGIAAHQYQTKAKRPSNSRLCCDKIYQQFRIKPSDWKSALNDISKYME
ncbi:NAD(P)-dependent oxidoreductase [Vibrio inusitatus NBRC 102082]|uniref:dTDP-4-dehydrorhamnose reductase n=1 Tax=Vibrio inusitatus NBRC 102082 TaxID=1219070 RepID=A0A4Y3I0Q4_9VIBR|nr:dTDP-4-dehydrorhamnose reductase [Vibrio inusitatus]GEA52831.1 NAD(P)-dependent oxidoreductase [Vibrio inusitatus NBRC 102082]